jgi:CubicO group peptidase (beta-lactamase class C family)
MALAAVLLAFQFSFSVSDLTAQGVPVTQLKNGQTTGVLSQKVDQYMQPYVEMNDFSGAILIAKDGNVMVRSFGKANLERGSKVTPKVKFRIGSISKQFTAAAILLLEERGKLSVEDKLAKYLPDFPNADSITIHQLLTHTAGLRANFYDEPDVLRSPVPINALVGKIKQLPSEAPGKKYSYSNTGYTILAYLIELVSGEKYGTFLKKNIFVPLNMKDTFDGSLAAPSSSTAQGYLTDVGGKIVPAPTVSLSNHIGNGSLYSTALDLYKWDRGLKERKLFREETYNKFLKEYGNAYGYGLSFASRFKRRWIGHDGIMTGFSSSFERYVDDDTCIIILSNVETGAIDKIRRDIAAIVFEKEYSALELRDQPFKAEPTMLLGYAGRYEVFPGFYLDVKVERNTVFLRGTSGEFTALTPESPTTFFYRHKYTRIQFDRSPEGQVTQLFWLDGSGNKFPCKRVK